jgi:hypothetical protein
MQKVMTRVLAVMLVASFVLAVVSFVWPALVSAEYYEVCGDGCIDCVYHGDGWCHWEEYIKVIQGTDEHCTDDWCHRCCAFWCGYDGCN